MNSPSGGNFPLQAKRGFGLLQNTVAAYFTDKEPDRMLFVRIKERFRQRASEWYCAANLAWLGIAMLHPTSIFAASPGYNSFQSIITEETMAVLLTALGGAWLVGLIINGARQRVTSTIRIACSLAGGVIYLTMALGFLSSYLQTGVLTAGVGTYFLTSALAFYSLYWVTIDKKLNG